MKTTAQGIGEQYAAALQEYLAGGGEPALERAYELGRQAVESGLGVLEIAGVYHQALAALLRSATAQETSRILKVGESFLLESLSPFEMTHRSFRESYAALRASEERYRELFENANDIVYTADLQGRFTSINRAGERLSGYSRDEAPTKHIADVVAPEYTDLVYSMLKKKLAGGGPTTYELEILTRDGRRVPLEVSTTLIYKDGKPVGVQGIARDITERKKAEEALRRLNEALEEQAKRIAHALHDDSGQLLASVHIAVGELASSLPSPSRERAQEIKRLLDQIEDQLRQYSHELRPTILDDLGLAPALDFLCQSVAKRTGTPVQVESQLQARLPPPVETALYRIVQEALTNIGKYARATRVTVRVWVDTWAICCSIADNGAGFDVSTTLAKKGRPGLGLIGIMGRLEALGGKLDIVSSPGRGTEIRITIPAEAAHAASAPAR